MILDTDIARSVAQQTEAALKRPAKPTPKPAQEDPNVERNTLAGMIKAGVRAAARDFKARLEDEARRNAEQEKLEKRGAQRLAKQSVFDGEFPYEPSDPGSV